MTNRKQAAHAAIAAAWAVAGVLTVGTLTHNPAPAAHVLAVAPLDDMAAFRAVCVARLAGDTSTLTASQLKWLRDCRDSLLPTPSPSPTPSGSPSASPTPSLSPSPSVSPTGSPTPSPTPSVPVSACPPLPAFPDANCTGWQHTGVTLHNCPNRLATPNTTYDSCRFTGALVIAASNITITRSMVVAGHVEGVAPSYVDLRGAVFQDFEIQGPGEDFYAAIGAHNYTCIRCNVHSGKRGFALGSNTTIIDSYAHDFWIQPVANKTPERTTHQTAASSHGGGPVRIIHTYLACLTDEYACSGGLNFYGEDSPINDIEIRNCYITNDSGYDIGIFGRPGKRFDITNIRVIDNILAGTGYGPIANWPSGAGNVWSGNRNRNGTPINP